MELDLTEDEYTALIAWRNAQKHLPREFRDFHDQKDLFKTIAVLYEEADKEDEKLSFKRVTWVEGHIYVIDRFLHFMALCGWTLQRSRKKLTFADYDELNAARQREFSATWHKET